MSTETNGGPLRLPDRPNLRHLRDQAKDLLRAGRAASLADAQFQIARLHGFASWPKLKAHVESFEEVGQLKQAIDNNDIARVQTMMVRNPALHRAPLGYGKMARSPGSPNAACLGRPQVRQDCPWRNGCLRMGRMSTKGATDP